MNIIIAGAGKVGFNLAKTLCIGHNVTIIDKNSDALLRIQENLDILPIKGNLENPSTYESFLDTKIDLFIAVTNLDEANIISCLVAGDILDIEKKVIRLKNSFFAKSSIKDKLEVDEVVFPVELASNSVVRLLDYPKANNVKGFEYTNLKLISFFVPSSHEAFKLENSEKVQIIGVERDREFILYKNINEILANDLVYIFGDEEEIKEICRAHEKNSPDEIKRCVVFGGDRLGVDIAKKLAEAKKEVKLVEKDLALCNRATEELEGKVTVINSKYGVTSLFEEEGLVFADMLISATKDDEYNIIKCIEAKEKGIKKVLAINNQNEYYSLMHSLGIVVVRGPKMSAYNTIVEKISLNWVVVEKYFCGGKAVTFKRKIFSNSPLIGKRIKELELDENITFIIRDEKIYRLNELEFLKESDLIFSFCKKNVSAKVKVWIYEL